MYVCQNLAEILRTQDLLGADIVAGIQLVFEGCLLQVILQQGGLADAARSIDDQHFVGHQVAVEGFVGAHVHENNIR